MSFIDTTPLQHSNILTLFADRDQIIMDPPYQRHGELWSEEKRQLLVDSILNRYDIPKLYFHKLDRDEAQKQAKSYAVIDGRQRLEALFDFMDGGFRIAKDFQYLPDPSLAIANLNANELAKKYPRIKQRFDSYNLPVICVETDDLDLIEEMFSRLNEAVPLNAAEKRNAIGGEMAKTIATLSESTFFRRRVRFSNSRYQHREAVTRMLFLEKCSRDGRLIDTKKPFLDRFVRDHRTGKSSIVTSLSNEVSTVLSAMSTVFADRDELLAAQATVAIYFLLFREAAQRGKSAQLTRAVFEKFQARRQSNRKTAEADITKAEFRLLEYDRLSQQGTNDASSIRERLDILREFCGI
jgi:hypothetical protein